MTETNEITTVKRPVLEHPATLQGLLAMAGAVPMEVPAHAQIVDIGTMYSHDEDDDGNCTHAETIVATFEWDA